MRLCVSETDPLLGRGAVIKVDGVVYDSVIEADEEVGFIVYYVRDADGNLMTNADRTAAVSRRIEGNVEITFPGQTPL